MCQAEDANSSEGADDSVEEDFAPFARGITGTGAVGSKGDPVRCFDVVSGRFLRQWVVCPRVLGYDANGSQPVGLSPAASQERQRGYREMNTMTKGL